MANVGRSNIEITADDRQAKRTISSFFKGLEDTGKRVSKTMSDFSPFEGLEKQVQRMENTIGKPLRNLPEHLKPFHETLNTTRRELRETAKTGTVSLGEMADATLKSSVAMEKLTSVSKSGKDAVSTIQDLNRATKETQLAILGLNKEGNIKISPEESTKRLLIFKSELFNTQKQLENLRDAGDFASFDAGMQQVERSLADVDKAMRAAAVGGRAYNQMIDELGVNTSNKANQMAIAMEGYKDRFIRSLDYMNARSTQSKKMMDILPEVSRIQTIDRAFLSIGNRMEEMAKKGMAANLAISMLGKDASMKDIADRVRLINQGLMRMQQVALVSGIAFAAFTAILWRAARGPDVGQVLEKQAAAMARYSQALNARTQEIASTWSLFEKVQLTYTSGKQLIANLQGQVNTLKNWRANLATIAQRAGTEFSLYLSKMGPSAAGEVAKIAKMSEPELNKYVALWREKHQLARAQATTELQALRMATQQEIQKLQNSITPLGAAIERFKAAWASAAGPFVESWGKVAAKVVDAATAVGQFIQQMNQLNPSLSTAAGWFMYLATGLSLILAPMAIGIGRANGMRAAFTYMFTTFRPLILGFTRIAGIVSVVSTVIIVVVGSFMKMWSASENLRTAVANLWTALKNGVVQAIQPLFFWFDYLKGAFSALIISLTGGTGTAKNTWKSFGDLFAQVVNWITNNVLPILKSAIGVAVNFIIGVIKALTPVIQELARLFSQNSGTIRTVVSTAFNIIGTVIKFVMTTIVSVISMYLNIALTIFRGITTAIQGIIQVFRGIVTGNWSLIWQGVVNILKGALQAAWGFIQLTLLGRIMGIFRSFAASAGAVISGFARSIGGFFTKMGTAISGTMTRIQSWVTSKMRAAANSGLAAGRSLLSGIVSVFTRMGSSISSAMSKIQSWISSKMKGAANAGIAAGRSLLSNLVSVFNKIGSTVSSVMSKVQSYITSKIRAAVNSALSTGRSLLSGLTSAFNSIATNAGSAFNRAKSAITKPIESAKKTVTGIIDSIKKAFNGLKLKLPKPDIPKPKFHFSKGNLKKGQLPTFDVTWHAKGGFFDRASVIGIGEKGPEAAVPLVGRRMDPFAVGVARKLGEIFGGMPGVAASTGGKISVEVPVFLDRREIARVVAPDIDKELNRIQTQNNRARGVV